MMPLSRVHPYEERLGLTTLEKRRVRGTCFNYLKFGNVDHTKLFELHTEPSLRESDVMSFFYLHTARRTRNSDLMVF